MELMIQHFILWFIIGSENTFFPNYLNISQLTLLQKLQQNSILFLAKKFSLFSNKYYIKRQYMWAKIEIGHNSPSTIFWEERTHNWGLPMLVVSLTTTEPLLLDHKFKSYTELDLCRSTYKFVNVIKCNHIEWIFMISK